MRILKDINELLSEGIIDQNTAGSIKNYYFNKKNSGEGKQNLVFGIFGALLAGLGIILILAHNWDDLSRGVKTFFSFLPLIAGQILCGYSLLKNKSISWKEAGSSFLAIATGACISLISQIYHIPGNLSSFLFTWSLLILPLVYIMRSRIVSLIYIILITWYACESFYFSNSPDFYFYLILLAAIFPYYIALIRKNPGSNFAVFHHWLIAGSISICLGIIPGNSEEIVLLCYVLLFGIMNRIAFSDKFSPLNIFKNAYFIISSVSLIAIFLTLSFDFFWEFLRKENYQLKEIITSPEIIPALILFLILILMQFFKFGKNLPLGPLPIFFTLIFFAGYYLTGMQWMMNLLILYTGLKIMQKGFLIDHLGILNIGIFILLILIICRFFDTQLSFVLRGLIFLFAGTGFFIANYFILKRRKLNEQ